MTINDSWLSPCYRYSNLSEETLHSLKLEQHRWATISYCEIDDVLNDIYFHSIFQVQHVKWLLLGFNGIEIQLKHIESHIRVLWLETINKTQIRNIWFEWIRVKTTITHVEPDKHHRLEYLGIVKVHLSHDSSFSWRMREGRCHWILNTNNYIMSWMSTTWWWAAWRGWSCMNRGHTVNIATLTAGVGGTCSRSTCIHKCQWNMWNTKCDHWTNE